MLRHGKVKSTKGKRSLVLSKVPKIDSLVEGLKFQEFHTRCISYGRVCKVAIHKEIFANIVSLEMVQKLDLNTTSHPKPYKACWSQNGVSVLVKEVCLVVFSIGKKYYDVTWFDVIHMETCHVLLGKSWNIERGAIHDVHKNTYELNKDGHKILLVPMPAEFNSKEQSKLLLKTYVEGELQTSVETKPIMKIPQVEILTSESSQDVYPVQGEMDNYESKELEAVEPKLEDEEILEKV